MSIREPGARSAAASDWVVLSVTLVVQLAVLYAPRAPSAASTPGLDKLVHATIFGAVAWAAVRCGVSRRVVAAVLLGHAVLSEVLQHVALPHRSGDPLDALADAVGVGLGLALAALLGRSHRSRRSGRPAETVHRV